MVSWLPPIAGAISHWVQATGGGKGPKPIAHPYLAGADPFVLGAEAVRVILDGITTERTAVTELALAIGREAEHELMVRAWDARSVEPGDNPEDFGAGWANWGPEVRLRVGLALIDCVMRATGWFEVVSDPNFVIRAGVKRGPKLVLVVKPEGASWLGERAEDEGVNAPIHKPAAIPPKPWSRTKSGGYWTPYAGAPRLTEGPARGQAPQAWDAPEMPLVYEALNHLQDVAWRINGRVLDVARAARRGNRGLPGLPLDEDTERPIMPPNAEDDLDVLRTWKRQTCSLIRRQMKRVAEVETAKRVLGIASEFSGLEEIFFPHVMNGQGRFYPIPVGLQPQGSDLARGLLEFAHGKAVTEENGGLALIASHLAACWGDEADGHDDRTAWARQREPLWRRIAADPLSSLEWARKGVSQPWSALAAIFEYVACLDQPGFVSRLPVLMDHSFNGTRHVAALSGYDAGPIDLARRVADGLQADLERIEAAAGERAESATYWLDLCGRRVPPSLTRQLVVLLPYGATRDTAFACARSWLDEHDALSLDLDTDLPETQRLLRVRGERLALIVARMWEAVKAVAPECRPGLRAIRECATPTIQAGHPITWTTPSGFVARQAYSKRRARPVSTMMDGQRIQLSVNETTDQLNEAAQLRRIGPNFVHSLDAAAATMRILGAKARGIATLTSRHDGFGGLAADMVGLQEAAREGFERVHETDVLTSFRAACTGASTFLPDRKTELTRA